jgi:DNA helicase-2/ATP-dependent DNA helicase PcrA
VIAPTASGSGHGGCLNPTQQDAVSAGDGPVLVVAGAGSGKTLTLAHRVAWLIERGVAPERILLLTFSRRAAREMLARAGRLTAPATAGRVVGGTFHAVANRLLRRFGRPVGIRADFTILDQADAADLMNLIRGELDLGDGERRFPGKDTLAAIYSRTVNAGTTLGDVLERSFPWCADVAPGIRSVFRAYTERKRAQNILDYDDLLLYWDALARAPGVGSTVAGLFDHILVDEYQDTNRLQADIVVQMRASPASPNVMVVGDDAQAIYAFRAATVHNILEFPDRFPGTRIIKLERNYRSTPPILGVSNAVIRLSPQRHDKTLWSEREGHRAPELWTCLDEAEQSDLVCRHLLEHREQGIPLRRQAVLFRTAHHSDLLEIELGRRNIPFVKYGGLKFLESAHVKDVLALLRILENPRDEVGWFRVLQLVDGIGPVAARRLLTELGVRGRAAAGPHPAIDRPEPASPLRILIQRPPTAPSAAREGLAALTATLADCMDEGASMPSIRIHRLRRFLEPVFVRLYASTARRMHDLEQLEQLASGYPTTATFLADLTLDPPASTADLAGPPLLDEDYAVLSTIHSAKGGEWDVVHLIHAADGMIPSDMATGDVDAIEEERRLLYVALTRARDALYVSFPLRSYRRPRGRDDVHGYTQLTRFIPEQVRRLFDLRSGPRAEAEIVGTAEEPLARGAVAAVESYLSGLWSD